MPYGLQGKRPLITLASASSIPMDDKTSGKTISVNTARIAAPTKDKRSNSFMIALIASCKVLVWGMEGEEKVCRQ